MTKEEKKDEMKNRISMALKDPILQQGFEIICKNLAELEADNRLLEQRGSDILKELLDKNKKCIELEKENAELHNNGFTVSAMTEQQLKVAIEKGKQLEKENAELKKELKDANEKVVHLACNQNKDLKYKLTKAEELIEDMYDQIPSSHSDYYKDVMERARQLLKELDK